MRLFPPIVFVLIALSTTHVLAAIVPDVSPADAARNAFAPTATRSSQAGPAVTTHHVLQLRGHNLRYNAIVSEWPVNGPDGKPIGVIVTEAYVVPTVAGVKRPVTFVYNGGPGASTWSLQMEGLGPRLYDASSGSMRDNPDSLLDSTDLVFVDPLGTGASFPLEGRDASSAWNTPGDARSVIEAIDGWLRANGRSDSAQFLLGESYGTLRTLAILHEDAAAPKLKITGIIMMSMFVDTMQDDDLASVALLPSLATTAYVHALRHVPASSPAQAYADALVFARTRYAPALWEGSALPAGRLHEMASEMSDQIGVPASVLEASRLRIDRTRFAHALGLADPKQHTGSLDSRATGGPELDALPAPYNDPSMTLGKRPASLMEAYLSSLGYRVAAPYRPLNLTINRNNWYYREPSAPAQDDNSINAVPWLVDAMKAHPALRVFTAGGYYDTVTPFYMGQYLLDHADIDRSRWISRVYPSGHGIAEDPIQRGQLANDLRSFIAPQRLAGSP